MALIGIFGAGGHGREVLPLVRAASDAEVVFVDDAAQYEPINGTPIINWQAFLAAAAPIKQLVLAVGNSGIREAVAARAAAEQIGFAHVQATNVMVMDTADIGEGAILSPFVCITANVRIGRHFHANVYASVAHDCVIGDFVTFAPRASCNGNVQIEDHAYIGAGAVLKQGTPGKPLRIGRGAVVGMGAVVTKDVTAGVTVVGNPARPMERR